VRLGTVFEAHGQNRAGRPEGSGPPRRPAWRRAGCPRRGENAAWWDAFAPRRVRKGGDNTSQKWPPRPIRAKQINSGIPAGRRWRGLRRRRWPGRWPGAGARRSRRRGRLLLPRAAPGLPRGTTGCSGGHVPRPGRAGRRKRNRGRWVPWAARVRPCRGQGADRRVGAPGGADGRRGGRAAACRPPGTGGGRGPGLDLERRLRPPPHARSPDGQWR